MNKNRWYDQSPEAIAKQFNSDLREGLSKKDASVRLRKYGKNTVYPVSKTPFRTYLLHILTDFVAILLLLSAFYAALVQKSGDAVTVLLILLCNYAVTVFTYVKAQRVLEKMSDFALPSAKVVRDGKLYLVKQEQLVPGDIISVSAGDIVPCDARLIFADRLFVMEAGVCNTDKPSAKDARYLEHRTVKPKGQCNMLFGSTIVTAGRGRAIVCDTGEDTLVCRSGKNPTIGDHDKLKVIDTIRRFCSRASLLMIAGVFILSLLGLQFAKGDFSAFDIYLLGLALSVSDMTELASAFAYVVVAAGVFFAMNRRKDVNTGALIKSASKMDRLKELNCLVIPKKCLYSEQDMRLEKLFIGERLMDIRDSSATGYERCLRYALISTGVYGMRQLVANNEAGENIYSPEQNAIIHAAERCGLYDRSLDREYPMVDHVLAGRNGSMFETTLVSRKSGYQVILRGSALSILPRCSRYVERGRILNMDADTRRRLMVQAEQLTKSNIRVLAIASKKHPYQSLVKIGQAQTDLTFEGLLCIEEPLIPGAAKYISQCKAAGIRVILFCTDVAENNRALAVSMGIAANAEECTNISQISHMKEDLIRANVSIYNMYEGLNHNQQRYIMRWLKEDYGCKIGVLGRELDDLILYSDAEVSFSEATTISGKNNSGVKLNDRNLPIESKNANSPVGVGCEALKFGSDVIVSPPDANGNGGFNAIVKAITTAKNIYRNLYLMVRYLLYSQGARALVAFVTFLTGARLLGTVQILFLGLIADLAAVMAIAFSKPDTATLLQPDVYEKKLGHLPRIALRTTLLSLPFALVALGSVQVFAKCGIVLSDAERISFLFVSFLLAQFASCSVLLLSDKKRAVEIKLHTAYLTVFALLAALLVFGFMIPGFGSVIGIVRFPSACWLGVGTVVLTAVAVLLIEMLIVRSKEKRRKGKNQTK